MHNSVSLIGNLGHDPELKNSSNGNAWSSFRIAVNDYGMNPASGQSEQLTYWFRCTCFGKNAENFAKFCQKGSKIGIVGKLVQRNYTDNNGQQRESIEIKVDQMEFLTKLEGAGAPAGNGGAKPQYKPNQQKPATRSAPPPPPPENFGHTEDIPF